mgnify:CR=1 FL=1
MSKIQILIDELCPEGIGFGNLGDFSEIYTGTQLNKTKMFEDINSPLGLFLCGWQLNKNIMLIPKIAKILKNMGIEIHTRSAFLHGLYFKEVDDLGLHFNSVKDKLKSLQQLSLSKKLPVEAICLGYVLHEPNIDKIIIGVDSSELFIKNIKLINNINIESDDFCDLSDYSVQNINILFPHHWKI